MKRIVLIFIATACTALGLYAQPAPTYTLKSCLEQGLLNNYSLRIVRNEEQVSKNNATLGNAGYLPTLDLSAGYKGTIDNTETKARATGETTKDNGVFDQTLDAGINLNWTIFDGFNITAGAQRLSAHRQRQGHLYQLVHCQPVRRQIQPASGRHQPRPRRRGVCQQHHRGSALAGCRPQRRHLLRQRLLRQVLRVCREAHPRGQGIRR